ncbi:MAG: DUF1284 domain-containing protein, partial [Oscillospiraceae bacterium]|nr:DUF1284 domain-containing protein [Oscillospiraceae bacterium]
GYSGEFSRHMGRVKALLEAGREVRLRLQADAVCAACPNRRGAGCAAQEKVLAYDRAVLARCALTEGDVLPFPVFSALVRQRILTPGLRGQICGGCQWEPLCR